MNRYTLYAMDLNDSKPSATKSIAVKSFAKSFVKAFLIVFAVVFLAGYIVNNSGTSSVSSTTAEYSKCIHSPETQFMVGYQKQKHPQLSNNMIAHIICTNK